MQNEIYLDISISAEVAMFVIPLLLNTFFKEAILKYLEGIPIALLTTLVMELILIAESLAKLSRVKAEIKLHQLATGVLEKIPIEKLVIPEMKNCISAECERAVAEIVNDFNNNYQNAIGKSGSIGEENSVHHLWNLIFKCMEEYHGATTRRVAYEWFIRNVSTDENTCIDFTFIPSTDKFLNWDNYSGGLELERYPSSSSLADEIFTANGPMAFESLKKATKHAAMCVYTRWLSEPTRQFKSFSCYADSRRLGLVRVSVKSVDPYCEVSETGAMDLPGFGNSSANASSTSSSRSTPNPALNLLYNLLYASDEDLEYFMTPPRTGHPEELEDGKHVSKLGAPLRSGSFTIVYHDLSAPGEYVIKCARNSSCLDKLKNEYDLLSGLLKGVRNIPKSDAVVRDVKKKIVALRLSPFSIPLRVAMSTMENNEKAIFLRNMGIEILATLRAAHTLKVSHNDVRCPNILVTPPLEVRKQLAKDPYNIYNNISKRTFDTCTFLLNDWGEATYHSRKDSQRFKDAVVNDLRGLVTSICKSDYMESSVSYRNNYVEHMVPLVSIFSDDVFIRLYAVASTNNEALHNELKRLV